MKPSYHHAMKFFPCFSRRAALVVIASGISLIAVNAEAGPPYVTDDPAPTDHQHWENFQFVSFTHVSGSTSGSAGLDLNYGAAENLQLTLVVPAEFDHADETHWQSGEIELAAKYRLPLTSTNGMPDIAFFPRVFVPTHHDEPAHLSVLLPVWLGKEHESWSWFGGGGYLINPGESNRNAWLGGIAVTRSMSERLRLGMEIYHQTPQSDDDQPFTGINVGVEYELNKHWWLLTSFGSGIQYARTEGQYSGYLALQAKY